MAIKKIHIMTIFGTRPEAIKLTPVINQLQNHSELFQSTVVVTAQHREMLDQMLRQFKIKADIDLDLMRSHQTLEQIIVAALPKLSAIIKQKKPEMILVQGDTTTTLAGALAGFYQKVPVGHVEAGLRTYNVLNPYPEEANRRMISVLAKWHYAATALAKNNLLKEGIDPKSIFVTGNTVVDTLRSSLLSNFDPAPWTKGNKKYILVTMHRRESFGPDFYSILKAIKQLAALNKNISFIFPVHPNPVVQHAVGEVFKKCPKNLCLMPSLDYNVFVNLLARSQLIITDSGGIQEEATALGLLAVVCRRVTERPEALSAGATLIEPAEDKIVALVMKRLKGRKNSSHQSCPFGDGKAAERITGAILWIAGYRDKRPRDFKYKE